MRRRLFIPAPVRQAIESHVRERLSEVEERYWAAAEDEDAFTGHLGALLGTPERKVMVDGQHWNWSIEYTKFRGKGKNATESAVGADGIFEIRVRGVEVEGQKSVLFQSKMGYPSGGEAREQALVMSNWREASVFLSYEPDGVKVFSIDDVMSDGRRSGKTFTDFFLDGYLACEVGDSDLQYDAKARTLRWRDDQGMKVAVKFPIPRRLRVSINSPFKPGSPAKIITPEEITKHRLDSTAEDRLGLAEQFSPNDLKRAKRRIALLYHPDRMPDLMDELKAVMNRRMAEINVAYAKLKNKR